MIHRIYSNLSSFKEITFLPGLNILLSEKSLGASERQTRNGAGKTSLVELIHFLLGANADKSSIFRSDALSGFMFGMEFELGADKIAVERSGHKPNDIILRGKIGESPIPLPGIDMFGTTTINNSSWKSLLGYKMFGINENSEEDQDKKFAPTFRSLFSYFVRRQMANAFNSPMRNNSMQQLWDQQVAISFFLGVEWAIPQQWQIVREQERSLKELRKAAGEGVLGAVIGTTAELRTELTITEDRAQRLRQRIESFQVLPEYSELEIEASELNRQLGDISDDNTLDLELLAELESSIRNESAPSSADLVQLYKEAGVVLPDTIKRRFEDVQSFHESIIQNRRLYLSSEIQSARQRINNRERLKVQLGTRQGEIMRLLKSHGALDQYAQLQSELARIESAAANLRQRFTAAEQLEGSKTELDIERNRLHLLLQQDYREQRELLQRAILAFQATSNALYEQAGSFTIDDSLNGPIFDIKIHGSKSKGISNMQIFCFDMMLMQLCSVQGIGPRFLIHDSHLFDGVDERQVGRALYVGEQLSRALGFQYIITMNSDVVPRDIPNDFDLSRYVLSVRLTDATVAGGLFGLRFG